jgi:hypothetical protein
LPEALSFAASPKDHIMKNSALPEMECLRAEVRDLRESVAELEDRLAEHETEDENPWGIWPYCWVVEGWDFSKSSFRSLQQKAEHLSMARRNRRDIHSQPIGELHLT